MNSLIPKRIKLIVNKGQDLQLPRVNKTQKNFSKKWRVLFLGVIEKMATAKVESDTGNPEWLCEITVTCRNAEDPISLLVTDSKGHHVGQVIIPLISIPSKPISDDRPNDRPPLLLTNLYKSELEPTKKNPRPQGYLYYWMWAEDYWQADEINKVKMKKSLSRSMHNLSSSTINLFRRKKSNTSYQGSQKTDLTFNEGNPFENYQDSVTKASPVRVNQLKNLNHKSGSDSSSSTYNSLKASGSGTRPNSPMSNGYHSKNPFDCLTTSVDISIENNVTKPERHETNNQVSLSHQASICSRESPASNNKRFGLFNKLRGKKSKSSVDLNKMASESEGRLKPILPQSLGKHQGIRLFEKKNEISKSSADITSWFVGDTQLSENQVKPSSIESKIRNRPQSCLLQPNNENHLRSHTVLSNHIDNISDPFKTINSINLNRHFSFNSNAANNTAFIDYEDKNKRELIDSIVSLENQLKVSCNKNCSLENEVIKLRNEKKALQDEFSLVRDELCKLKFKLLEAGDTKYLEKSRADEISEMALWRANSKF